MVSDSINGRGYRGIESVLTSLDQTEPGSHSIVVYPCTEIFREIYTKYIKKELANGHLVLILPYYETVESVKNSLKKIGLNVEKNLKDRSLIIMDGYDVFFHENEIHDPEQDNIVSLMRIMQSEVLRLQKKGATVILDLGCFFTNEEVDTLIDYEKSVPETFTDTTFKQFCMYHQNDFELRFTSKQKARILDEHGRSMIMVDN